MDRAEEDKVRVWEGYEEDNFEESDSDDGAGTGGRDEKSKKKKKKSKDDKNAARKVMNARSMSAVLGRYPPWIEQSLAKLMARHGYQNVIKYAKDVEVLDQRQLLRILESRIRATNRSEGHDR